MSTPAADGTSSRSDVVNMIRTVADRVLDVAKDLTVVFVTNLQTGDIADVGPDGIVNTAQYYTRRQADEIIRSLQSLGVTVQAFFNEIDFMRWAASRGPATPPPRTVVFTTAEGGSGSGRRALIPAVCDLLGLPVLNSGPHACTLARHKFHANAVLRRAGVRVPASWQFKDDGWIGLDRPPNGSRVIVKPTYESMCIGIAENSVQVVDRGFEDFAREKRDLFRQPVLVQEFVSGEEVGVPILRIGSTYALPAMSFRRANGDRYGDRPKTFLDENIDHDISLAVFESNSAQYSAVQRAAVLAFDALDMRGVGRIDMRIDADGRHWVFDTNESPPPLRQTAYATSMETLGFSLEEMLAVWLGVCLLDHRMISGL